MTPFNSLRTLARSPYWQIVYSRSKEMAQIGLFENQTEFTPLQINFLQWLEIYHSLEIDLAMKKPHLDREIIEDDVRVDAYLYWREITGNKTEKEISELETNAPGTMDGSVVFISKK
jgi:hypothetical protein